MIYSYTMSVNAYLADFDLETQNRICSAPMQKVKNCTEGAANHFCTVDKKTTWLQPWTHQEMNLIWGRKSTLNILLYFHMHLFYKKPCGYLLRNQGVCFLQPLSYLTILSCNPYLTGKINHLRRATLHLINLFQKWNLSISAEGSCVLLLNRFFLNYSSWKQICNNGVGKGGKNDPV